MLLIFSVVIELVLKLIRCCCSDNCFRQTIPSIDYSDAEEMLLDGTVRYRF